MFHMRIRSAQNKEFRCALQTEKRTLSKILLREQLVPKVGIKKKWVGGCVAGVGPGLVQEPSPAKGKASYEIPPPPPSRFDSLDTVISVAGIHLLTSRVAKPTNSGLGLNREECKSIPPR